MPLSFRQLGNLFVAGPNINIYPSGNTFAISGNATNTGTTGFSGITSAGTGQFLIASSITNNNLVYKTLSGAGGFSIIDNGLGLLTFTSSTSSGSGTIISGTNIGTGTGVFCGLTTTVSSNDTMRFANLSGGPNFSVALNDNDEIFVDRGQTVINSFRNEGGGAKILSSITATRSLVARTLSGVGFNVITASTVVSIRPTNTTASRFYISDSTGLLTTSSLFGQDSTNGTIGVGTAALTTSRMAILANSTTVSQLRLQKSSFSVTSPNDGDIYYITTGNTLKFEKGTVETDFLFKDSNYSLTSVTNNKILIISSSGTISTKNVVDFGIFNTVSSLTISDTASETSIISTELVTGNTKTLLSSADLTNPQLVVGKKFRFNAKGTIQTTGSVNLTVKMKLGSTILANTGSLALTSSISASTYFEIDSTFTIRTTGATGTVIGSGKITSDTNLVNGVTSKFVNIATQNELTIDTTSDKIFDVTAQFGTANINNSITIYEATLEYLN
jgi:hypothetical protein